MNKGDLERRFFQWVLKVLDLISLLPNDTLVRVISFQLTKSCTSSGANYRAGCRAKSIADMINKFKIVEEELDESIYWMQIIESKYKGIEVAAELKEANELLSIMVASIKTLRTKNSKNYHS